ncbi:MAG: DUF3604 domain-containing protein [Acidobacteria bacterium]|nr:DUF3604 domain-containing protein [Acidobacteriota bacterium]
MSVKTVVLILCSCAAAVLFVTRRQVVYSQSVPAGDDAVVSLRVRFGLGDREPASWDGSVSAANGEVLEVRNWHPRPGDRVDRRGWSLSTRKGTNFARRAWEEEIPSGVVEYLNIPGLILDVKATEATTLELATRQGTFVVTPRRVEAGSPLRALGGRVVVDRVPTARKLSAPDYQSDFASMLGGANGEVWVAWVAFKDNASTVLARRFDGAAWEPAQQVAPRAGDIFLAKMGRDAKGRPWVVWSEQVDGNWDLYGRRLGDAAVERLTTDPQPDIHHQMATDSKGNLWLVWQGFRNGKSGIFARRYDGGKWSEAERVSVSPANDWEPAIAADGEGRVYVAWDTYDQGNYDVLMRTWAAGRWSDPAPVAATPKYEAHVSLACDRQNRLWAAWNESGMQWGKDAGFLVKKEATRLYQSRWIGLAVYAGGAWREPAPLPEETREYSDFPIIQMDGAGRPWLFYRRRMVKFQDVHSNTPAHRAAWEIFGSAYDGAGWTAPVAFPSSAGRMDMRGGFASDGRGNLYAAWATDNRDFEEFLFQHADVYAARLPALGGAAGELKLQPRAAPALKTFPVHEAEAEDLARIRGYRIDSGGQAYRIYRGDTHRHTEFSMDGNNDGSLQQTYRYAMDAAELDYLGVSDHNQLGGPDIEYVRYLQQQMADLLYLPRRFTPVYAYERGVPYPNGHRNVIFARRGNPTLPIPQAESRGQDGAQALYQYLKKYNGIAISHTSATSMGTDWRDNDPSVEPLVEMYQGDRVSAEYEGAPKAAHGGNLASAPGGFRPAGYVWNAWKKGYKLGVQVSSDHLSTHISYACTLATDFTREGLLAAMGKRHSYGATDNIVLDYRLQAGGKEYLQGDIAAVDGEFKLWVKVIGTQPIRQIDIVKNNTFVHTRQPLERQAAFTFADPQATPGESYYYVRVIQVDDQMAWSSPIWITRR